MIDPPGYPVDGENSNKMYQEADLKLRKHRDSNECTQKPDCPICNELKKYRDGFLHMR